MTKLFRTLAFPFLAIALILCFDSKYVSAGPLEACPVPPFVSGSQVPPNVMIILDHSGSMGDGAGSRWDTAKRVVIDIIDQFPGIRFGLMRMDGSNYTGEDQIGNEDVVRQGGENSQALWEFPR